MTAQPIKTRSTDTHLEVRVKELRRPNDAAPSSGGVIANPPPAPPAARQYPVIEEYDKVDDRTTFTTRFKCGNLDVTIVGVVFRADGTGKVIWLFSSATEDWTYLRFHSLRLLCQPGAIRYSDEGDREGKIKRGYVTESIVFKFSSEVFQSIAASETLDGRLGPTDLVFSRDILKSMATLAERMTSEQREVQSGVSQPSTAPYHGWNGEGRQLSQFASFSFNTLSPTGGV